MFPFLLVSFLLVGGFALANRAGTSGATKAPPTITERSLVIDSRIDRSSMLDKLSTGRRVATMKNVMLTERDPEPFADDLFSALGSAMPASAVDPTFGPPPAGWPRAYNIWNNAAFVQPGTGLEYLADVPATAEARVAAMMARVAANPAPTADMTRAPTTLFGALQQASALSMSKLATSVTAKFSIGADAWKIGEQFGVGEQTAQSWIKSIRTASKQSDSVRFLDSAIKTVKPVADALGIALRAAADERPPSDVAIESSLALISMAMGAVPILGQLWGAGLSLANGALDATVADRDGRCAGMVRTIRDARSASLDAGFPAPLHAESTYSAACPVIGKYSAAAYRDEPAQESLLALYRESYAYFSATARPLTTMGAPEWGSRGLSIEAQAHVRRWWAVALTFMSDPRVADVFWALGRDSQGGTLASDEQVLLVAAPIAVANGVAVEVLARELWRRSRGWRAVGEESMVHTKLQRSSISYNSDNEPIISMQVVVPDVVANSWQAQWAALSRDAFEIVKSMPRPEPAVMRMALVSGSQSASSAEETGS
ncbi:hypothetical protein [Gemmatimonas sp.]|uniref:hypothetical protein n=1 Tax=Gemmatimonas sp. TaxID=1962908 RepID=UPI0039835541